MIENLVCGVYKMKKSDIIVIGMGPAGMAVSAMGSAMGLKVIAIEKHKVGGECLNVGCIPSKALLKAGDANYIAKNLIKYGIESEVITNPTKPLEIVRKKIEGINNKKFLKTFEKVDLVKGTAEFVDKRTVRVDNEIYTAKKIFIATGTEPFIPPIAGLKKIRKLTNVNLFHQTDIPKRLIIIGGGAIGSEMAQAFHRLGSEVVLIQADPYLIPTGDEEAGRVLEEQFKREGIQVFNNATILKVEENGKSIKLHSDKGIFESDEILVATGRMPVLKNLKLEKAGVKYTNKNVLTNAYLQTNVKHIYAIGDCNGRALLSHAAMHQGMIALMNAVNPFPVFKKSASKYIVPWSVFTNPEIAQAGLLEKEAIAKGISYELTRKEFSSYGRTIADGQPEGFIKILTNKRGRVLGVTIVGSSASEMIHEWIIVIQMKLSILQVMMTQHAFPTISMLNKMVAEQWMMEKMDNRYLQKAIKFIF